MIPRDRQIYGILIARATTALMSHPGTDLTADPRGAAAVRGTADDPHHPRSGPGSPGGGHRIAGVEVWGRVVEEGLTAQIYYKTRSIRTARAVERRAAADAAGCDRPLRTIERAGAVLIRSTGRCEPRQARCPSLMRICRQAGSRNFSPWPGQPRWGWTSIMSSGARRESFSGGEADGCERANFALHGLRNTSRYRADGW